MRDVHLKLWPPTSGWERAFVERHRAEKRQARPGSVPATGMLAQFTPARVTPVPLYRPDGDIARSWVAADNHLTPTTDPNDAEN